MSKSKKLTVRNREQQVVKLLLAGADFGNIQQYAEQDGWNVSDRQLRRYVQSANREFAKLTKTERAENLGRHLRQRRLLYSHAMKNGDVNTALRVVHDEAKLQGLYAKDDQEAFEAQRGATISCRERLVRTIRGRHKPDFYEVQLMQRVTPRGRHLVSDLQLAEITIGLVAMTHANQQLEFAASAMNARLAFQNDPDAPDTLAVTWALSSYLFKAGREGWRKFTQDLDIDGEKLLKDNYLGDFLFMMADTICEQAPTAEEVLEEFAAIGKPQTRLITPEDFANQWREEIQRFTDR